MRRENQQLRKEISSLRKQINKLSEEPKYEEFEELSEIAFIQENRCPACSSPLKVTNLGLKELTSCTACNYRKTKPLQK